MSATPSLPAEGPFTLRARLLTPLSGGGHRWEPDARVAVDAGGRITAVERWSDRAEPASGPREVDIRPWVLMPGWSTCMPTSRSCRTPGRGAGLDLLTWLERYIFPLERAFDRSAAERLAPLAYRAFAAAGTTTAVLYGAVRRTASTRRSRPPRPTASGWCSAR